MIFPDLTVTTASVERPTQAVILAGGRGTRLASLTTSRPKPMVEVHGKPFLEYLVEMLREQGFRRILLLLGYLPEVIQDYFGDGSRWGVEIEYAVSAVDDETGRRLQLAESRLDPLFLLLYCDNYWPMNFAAMWRRFTARDPLAQITIYRNRDHTSRDNIRVDEKGTVVAYDKERKTPGLAGVDIGFVLLRRSVIAMLSGENPSFERCVYPLLIERGQLQGFITDHRYYSVGSIERLPLVEQVLARRPTVFLDRDGVLNRRMPRATYVCSWSQWQWLPGSLDALRLLKSAGHRVIVITNQPGIARGALSRQDLATIHERMQADARAAGGEIDAVYCCTHNWDDGCDCRKPRPGMLYQAQRDFHLDLSRTWLIGDDERDAQAAEAAGCPWALVDESNSLLDLTRKLLSGQRPAK